MVSSPSLVVGRRVGRATALETKAQPAWLQHHAGVNRAPRLFLFEFDAASFARGELH